MNNSLDLSMEVLEDIDAPLTDLEWGLLAGAAFTGGILIGIAIT